jgi:hypothetical protein
MNNNMGLSRYMGGGGCPLRHGMGVSAQALLSIERFRDL